MRQTCKFYYFIDTNWINLFFDKQRHIIRSQFNIELQKIPKESVHNVVVQ